MILFRAEKKRIARTEIGHCCNSECSTDILIRANDILEAIGKFHTTYGEFPGTISENIYTTYID